MRPFIPFSPPVHKKAVSASTTVCMHILTMLTMHAQGLSVASLSEGGPLRVTPSRGDTRYEIIFVAEFRKNTGLDKRRGKIWEW